uniref:Uncharacterized protein n=1 Tax=viral metagenome TaxID=1070528 RepID=A0A6C0KMK7_9ZZZZ
MAQPVYPDRHTISAYQAFPLPRFVVRTRREVDTIDSINARQFEHWQTDGKYETMNRPDMNKQAPFYDMLPNGSRMSERNYRSQPRYDVNEPKGVENPYFNKYDTSFDARNMTRELRASVYEDKNTGYLKESGKLLQRNFNNRWLHSTVVSQQAQAAEQIRPEREDLQHFYVNQPISDPKSL